MLQYNKAQNSIIHVPVGAAKTARNLNRATEELRTVLSRDPTSQELADRLNLSVSQVDKLMVRFEKSDPELFDCLSLDDLQAQGVGPELVDLTTDVEEEAQDHELRDLVERMLRCLTRRERHVLQLRFGLADNEPMSQQSVAAQLRIDRGQVIRAEVRAFKKIRIRYPDAKVHWLQ